MDSLEYNISYVRYIILFAVLDFVCTQCLIYEQQQKHLQLTEAHIQLRVLLLFPLLLKPVLRSSYWLTQNRESLVFSASLKFERSWLKTKRLSHLRKWRSNKTTDFSKTNKAGSGFLKCEPPRESELSTNKSFCWRASETLKPSCELLMYWFICSYKYSHF